MFPRTVTITALPFGSTAGTRNPFKMTADGNHLTMKVAPDNGDEGNGTEIFSYEASVTPAR